MADDININPVSVDILFQTDKAAHYVYQWYPPTDPVPTLPTSDFFRNIPMNVGDMITVIGVDAVVLCVCIAQGKDGPIVSEYDRVSIPG